MSENAENIELKFGVIIKLEKYAPGVSQDDIDAGRAKPLEVIIIEEDEL